ncbi:hypothetical protein QP157_02915 [Sphingomonas sp. LR61]
MIQTVLGPVESSGIGAVSMHEHLLTDASALQRPGVEALEPSLAVTADLAAALRWSQLALADNLRLDDVDLLADELRTARNSGLGLAVDLSSLGFGPDHARLPELSRASGVGIVAGYGAYLPRLLPEWYLDLDTDGRQGLFERALTDSVPGTTYRAGLLGLMGTTTAFATADGLEERRSLTAAARAAATTGAAVVVRLAADARNGLEVLAHVVAEGSTRAGSCSRPSTSSSTCPTCATSARQEPCSNSASATRARTSVASATPAIRNGSTPSWPCARAPPTPAGSSVTPPGRRASSVGTADTASTT